MLYERLLPSGGDHQIPMFGADQSIAVGARWWDASGRFGGLHHFERDGQIAPVALLGSGPSRRVVAMAWGSLFENQEREGPASWLLRS